MITRFRFSSLLITGIGLLLTMPSSAQEIDPRPLDPYVFSKNEANAPGIGVIHVTDRLTNSPEGQEALRNYIEARNAGLLAARKGGSTYVVGMEKTFNVLKNIQGDATWESRTFVLRSTNTVANVWIDVELNDDFSEDNLATLDEHMLRSTPSSSFRPDKGIIENNNYLFGNPPNYDGDGKVDILLYDIKEGGSGSCCVLGYVTSADINPKAGSNEGNQADVLYVDLPDGMSGGVTNIAWIVSHEYQHLIHYAYQTPPGSELTFVNEGLSEWASIVNGYFHRSIRYLGLKDQALVDQHSTPLLDWNTDEDVYDYERAGLFTTYIAQQIGPEATGSIVRAKPAEAIGDQYSIGDEGYRVVLEENGTTLGSVIGGFHTANFVNDQSVDPMYGYELTQRHGIGTAPTNEIDGTKRSQYSQTDFKINPGAVRYFSWTQVANLSLSADIYFQIAEQLKEGQRKRIELRVFKEYADGRREIETISLRPDKYDFSGDFSRVTLVVASTSSYGSTPIRLDVNSSWNEAGSTGVVRQTVSYEDGKVDTLFYSMPKEAMLANKFPVPENSRLASVHVAPVYDTDFANSDAPDGSPRDFQLRIWQDNGSGAPGDLVYSHDVTESPSTRHINFSTGQFSFLEIALPDTSVLTALGDSVFVGLANHGSDINYLALTPSRNPTAGNVAYLYYPFSNGANWARFDGITVGDEAIFEGTVHPIRAEFVVSTSAEETSELPTAVTLSQNYPNPFNPSTSISYALPKTMQVRLAVYDALGRRVATLVDGVQPSGAHEVQLEAGNWASGVYFYTLETEAQIVSKRMVLMK